MSFSELKIKLGKKVLGNGSDSIGQFNIEGKKLRQNLEVRFSKKYEDNSSAEIEYKGYIDEELKTIIGDWSIKQYGISGDFRLEKVI